MLLLFGAVKIVLEPGGKRRKPVMYLRYKWDGVGHAADANELSLEAAEGPLISFCFPLDVNTCVPKEYMASEEYTFTLTGGDGRRFQGFCRKFLPPKPSVGSKLQLPQVLCLVSEQPWHTFFFKVLQVLEQLFKGGEGLLNSNAEQLPGSSHAAQFLQDLGQQLDANPKPSQTIRVKLPKSMDLTGSSPQGLLYSSLKLVEESVELTLPLDAGNGRWNAGISLARLLWQVPARCLTSLIAGMMMERRILLVSTQRDTVTACVQAAAALLYPFKWHHVYLPMLPLSLKDYLSAPMPFLVGLPAQMLSLLSSIPMDETLIIDLDLGTCTPAPGAAGDDGLLLPWREQLEAALHAVHKLIRSPTEHETSPLIASIMQEFFLKLFGNYRRFVHEDSPVTNTQWASMLSSLPTHNGAGSSLPSPRTAPRESTSGRATPSTQSSTDTSLTRGSLPPSSLTGDHTIRGSGFVFEHTAFVHSHRRIDKARAFLTHFRGSQMYLMWLQERLELAAAGSLHDSCEPFEIRINKYQASRRMRFEQLRSSANKVFGPTSLGAKWLHQVKRHRRMDSEEKVMGGSVHGLDLATSASADLCSSSNAPMRRIVTDPDNLVGTLQQYNLDPSTFFREEEEDFHDLIEDARAADGGRGVPPGLHALSEFSSKKGTAGSWSAHMERAAASFPHSGGPTALQQHALQQHALQQLHLGHTESAPTTPRHLQRASTSSSSLPGRDRYESMQSEGLLGPTAGVVVPSSSVAAAALEAPAAHSQLHSAGLPAGLLLPRPAQPQSVSEGGGLSSTGLQRHSVASSSLMSQASAHVPASEEGLGDKLGNAVKGVFQDISTVFARRPSFMGSSSNGSGTSHAADSGPKALKRVQDFASKAVHSILGTKDRELLAGTGGHVSSSNGAKDGGGYRRQLTGDPSGQQAGRYTPQLTGGRASPARVLDDQGRVLSPPAPARPLALQAGSSPSMLASSGEAVAAANKKLSPCPSSDSKGQATAGYRLVTSPALASRASNSIDTLQVAGSKCSNSQGDGFDLLASAAAGAAAAAASNAVLVTEPVTKPVAPPQEVANLIEL